jgi:hypothetical protein
MNIEQFYSADERRRRSREVELGSDWFDAAGNRYELSWVEDTGELYIMLERVPEAGSWTPFGDVEVDHLSVDEVVVSVIGYLESLAEVEGVLAGWQEEMAKPDAISWVAERLRRHGIPATAPA